MAKLKRQRRKQLLYWTDLIYVAVYLIGFAVMWVYADTHTSHRLFQFVSTVWICAPPMFGLATFMTRISFNDAANEDIDLNNKLVDIREKLNREKAS